jgi:hypothetical protein
MHIQERESARARVREGGSTLVWRSGSKSCIEICACWGNMAQHSGVETHSDTLQKELVRPTLRVRVCLHARASR